MLLDECFVLLDFVDEKLMICYVLNFIIVIINVVCLFFVVVVNFFVVFVIVWKVVFYIFLNVFLVSLVCFDFMVGMLVQFCYVVFCFYENILYFVLFCLLRIVYLESFWVCYGVLFLMLSVISIEWYVVLYLYFCYKELVIIQCVFMVVMIIWVLDIVLMFMEWIV